MARTIDLNSDLGEGFGAWRAGDDTAMLDLVTSANIACGGHAGDPETMAGTLRLAHERGVRVGAHPGYADREGFGRRPIPHSAAEVEHLVAAQLGALMGMASLVGAAIDYVKPHGALANLAADDEAAARAVARAAAAVSPGLAILAISGTTLERVARDRNLVVYSEIFADRAYLASGRLVPRDRAGAMIADAAMAASRLLAFLETGLMPSLDGPPVALQAQSICVHGDNAHAVAMARTIRAALQAAGVGVAPFLAPTGAPAAPGGPPAGA